MSLLLLRDEYWMREAIRIAKQAQKEGEWPFGCVIVIDITQEAIGEAGGTHMLLDATKHSEIQAIQQACALLGPGGEDLSACTLYSTHSPCSMCAGAINHAKIGRVVWGSEREDLPNLFRPLTINVRDRLLDTSHPPELVPGVLRDDCVALFQNVKVDT